MLIYTSHSKKQMTKARGRRHEGNRKRLGNCCSLDVLTHACQFYHQTLCYKIIRKYTSVIDPSLSSFLQSKGDLRPGGVK